MNSRLIITLILAMVITLAAIVCVSFANEETYESGKVSYVVINSTGKNVTLVGLSDMRSENRMEAAPREGGLSDGESVGIELPAMLDKGAPDVMFTFTVDGGDNLSVHLSRRRAPSRC